MRIALLYLTCSMMCLYAEVKLYKIPIENHKHWCNHVASPVKLKDGIQVCIYELDENKNYKKVLISNLIQKKITKNWNLNDYLLLPNLSKNIIDLLGESVVEYFQIYSYFCSDTMKLHVYNVYFRYSLKDGEKINFQQKTTTFEIPMIKDWERELKKLTNMDNGRKQHRRTDNICTNKMNKGL